MKGRAIKYSAQELAWLEANRGMVIGDYYRAFQKRFQRQDVSANNLHALRKRKGWKTGRTGQFQTGQKPHNKGKKMPFHPNSARTQFKKGNLPHNANHLGHERVSKDGYVEISIDERNPHTGYERRYVLKHRYLWEKANGPVPEGMCLKCRDGNKTNTDPENWILIPRALLPRLNGGKSGKHPKYDEAEPELRPTILAVAQLSHAAKQAKSGEHHD
jgi:hypothetical protein